MTLRELWNLLTEAYGHWGADRANRMAAALSFSITLSSAPLLVVGIAVAGLVLEQESVQQTLAAELAGILGEGAAEFVQAVLASAIQVVSRSGLVPPAVALVVTFLGASGWWGRCGVLDDLWGVRPATAGPGGNIVGTVKERLFDLAGALGVGLALLASLAVNTLVAGAIRYVAQVLPVSEFMVRLGNLLVWTVVATFVFAAMFCAIPDVRIARRDALLGAAVTSILFNLGHFGISIYRLGTSSVRCRRVHRRDLRGSTTPRRCSSTAEADPTVRRPIWTGHSPSPEACRALRSVTRASWTDYRDPRGWELIQPPEVSPVPGLPPWTDRRGSR